ncbi:MAG: hypothetical protein AB7V77_03160 [Candidatus Woesearchaeota archaeon]
MFSSKKGSEMSMNIIIIAAIALLILVILTVMLLNKSGDINDATGCSSLGGQCSNMKCDTLSGDGWGFPRPMGECEAQGGYCCIKI